MKRQQICMGAGGACLLVILATPPAVQATVDGQRLLHDCQELIRVTDGGASKLASGLETGFCGGYLRGALDLYRLVSGLLTIDKAICLSEHWTIVQYARVLVQYLQHHPDRHLMDGSVVVYLAMQEAFPCPPPTKGTP